MPAKPTDPRVLLAQVQMLFGLARGNMSSMLAGAIVVGLVLWSGGTPLATIGIWGLMFLLACSLVIWFEHRVQGTGITADNCRRLLRERVALASMVSLFYGAAGFLLPDKPTPLEDTFLFITLSTMVTVGSLAFSVMPLMYQSLNIWGMLPLMAHYAHRHLQHAEPIYLVLLAVAAIWQLVVMGKTRRVSDTSINAIALTLRLHDEVDEHKRTKEAMQEMALHDALTGLGNRRYFDDVFAHTISNAARDLGRVGVLAIDLNQFKPVNDRFGHAVGDALLKSVAQRLRDCTRAGDFCARMGGDEFAVVVNALNEPEAIVGIADKVRDALRAPHALGAIRAQSIASVGWAVYPEDGLDMARLMHVADERMYREKYRRPAASAAPVQLPVPARPEFEDTRA